MNSNLESTDTNTKIISQDFFVFYILSIITTIVLYIIFGSQSDPAIPKSEILKESASLFLTITTGFGVLSGVKIYDSKKSGDKYYKFAYGREIDKLVQDKIVPYYEEKIEKFIWKTIKENKDKYWKAVFELQNESDEFRKIWNDYNYYTNCKNDGLFSQTDEKRLKNAEKAVFSMVYEKIKSR